MGGRSLRRAWSTDRHPPAWDRPFAYARTARIDRYTSPYRIRYRTTLLSGKLLVRMTERARNHLSFGRVPELDIEVLPARTAEYAYRMAIPSFGLRKTPVSLSARSLLAHVRCMRVLTVDQHISEYLVKSIALNSGVTTR